MAHKAEGIMSTQVLRSIDDWEAFRTLMILNDETHLTLSIDDVDHLLKGAGNANISLGASQAELQRLRSLLATLTADLESIASRTRSAAR